MIDLSSTKLFVFDFDGTLVRSNAIKREALYDVVADIDGASTVLDEMLCSKPKLDRYGIFRELANIVEGVDAEAITCAYSKLCHKRILATDEVPGAYQLLKTLHELGRISVVSSATPENSLKELVAQLRFSPFLHQVYGRPAGKSDNLEKAMASAGVRASDTVVIGDGEKDRESAEQATCRFVGVVSDGNNFERAPDALVDRLDQLIPALTSPQGP